MVTRSLILVYYEAKFRVAQFTLLAGYPSGVGADILRFFIKDPNRLQALKNNMHVVRFVSLDELRRLTMENDRLVQQEEEAGVGKSPIPPIIRQNPAMSSAVGAQVLDLILAAKDEESLFLIDNCDFADQHLDCEWIYVIDLDRNMLEVYGGVEQIQSAQCFTDRWINDDPYKSGRQAGPSEIRQRLAEFSLTKLPDSQMFVLFFKEISMVDSDDDT